MWWAPNTGIWFIWALAIFMVATKLVSSAHHATSIAFAAMVSILTFGEHLQIDLFTHRNVLQYFVFFLFGCWYGKSVVGTITQRPFLMAFGGFLRLRHFICCAGGYRPSRKAVGRCCLPWPVWHGFAEPPY
jgi:hypothetical protein